MNIKKRIKVLEQEIEAIKQAIGLKTEALPFCTGSFWKTPSAPTYTGDPLPPPTVTCNS